jgi:hypothetical protein
MMNTPPTKEPLLSALGGFPLSLKAHIETALDQWQTSGLTPVFVFDGMDIGKPDKPFDGPNSASRANTAAWDLYDQHQAHAAVAAFGDSGKPRRKTFHCSVSKANEIEAQFNHQAFFASSKRF